MGSALTKMQSWQAVASVIVFSFILYHVWLAYFHPLANIPGPTLARFSELWKFIHMWRADFSSALAAEHAKYGKLVRIAPNEISILDAADINTIYGHGTKFIKSRVWYGAWKQGNTSNHFDDTDPASHAKRRRAVASVYSLNSLLTLEQFMDTNAERFFVQLDRFAETGEAIDLAKWLHFYAFDAVGELALGTDFGLLQYGEDRVGVLHALEYGTNYSTITGQLTATVPITRTVGARKTLDWLLGINTYSFRNFVEQTVGKRLSKQADDRNDMFAMFRKCLDPDTKQPLSMQRVMAECFNVLGAGSDTTATAMRAFFYHLLQNPNSYMRLQKEVDEAYESGKASEPLSHRDASKLDYFNACLKEGMRLNPSVGMHMPRVVPAGGATLAGRHFPAGSVVGVSGKLVHRTIEAYGFKAQEYNPERWLVEDDKELNRNFLAFGGGSRVCIGKNISLMEMSKLLPMLIRRYHFQLANTSKGVWRNNEAWFETQTDFFVTVQKRTI